MDMHVFKRLVSAVLLAGLMAGLLLTLVQQLQVTGIILQAEGYEAAAASATAATATAAHDHPAGTAAHEHEHEHAGWAPNDGFERVSWTAFANIAIAVGFGLMLAAAIVASGKNVNWRSGLVWGLAGYVVFFVAPSLGLPPEVPGTAAAPLADRQSWWLMTVLLTSGGLALLAFGRNWLKIVGLALLILPHTVGAPQPEMHGGVAPQALIESFIVATAIANAVFWLALGSLTGLFYRRFA